MNKMLKRIILLLIITSVTHTLVVFADDKEDLSVTHTLVVFADNKEDLYKSAQAYQQQTMYEEAALLFEQFANKHPNDERAATALSNAMLFYIGLDQFPKTLALMKAYKKLFKDKDPKQEATVFYSIGYLYYNDKDWKNVKIHYQRYLKDYKSVEVWDEIISAHQKIADAFWQQKKPNRKKALIHYTKAISIYNSKYEDIEENMRKAIALIATSKSRYHIALEAAEQFTNISTPVFKPKKRLPKKIKRWWDTNGSSFLTIGKSINYVQSGFGVDQSLGVNPENALGSLMNMGENCQCFGYGGLGLSDTKPPTQKNVSKPKPKIPAKKEPSQTMTLNEKQADAGLIQFIYWHTHTLNDWVKEKISAHTNAGILFGEVAKMHVPEWEMAAAAKAADMQMQMAESFQSLPVIGDEKLQKKMIKFWKVKAEPYRVGGLIAYEHCHNMTLKVRWFNETSRHCAKQLSLIDDKKYPPNHEILIDPRINKHEDWYGITGFKPNPIPLQNPNDNLKKKQDIKLK